MWFGMVHLCMYQISFWGQNGQKKKLFIWFFFSEKTFNVAADVTNGWIKFKNISHLPFHGVACGVRVAQSLIICVVFCRLLFGFLSFFDHCIL
jgi:hypothetical protein